MGDVIAGRSGCSGSAASYTCLHLLPPASVLVSLTTLASLRATEVRWEVPSPWARLLTRPCVPLAVARTVPRWSVALDVVVASRYLRTWDRTHPGRTVPNIPLRSGLNAHSGVTLVADGVVLLGDGIPALPRMTLIGSTCSMCIPRIITPTNLAQMTQSLEILFPLVGPTQVLTRALETALVTLMLGRLAPFLYAVVTL